MTYDRATEVVTAPGLEPSLARAGSVPGFHVKVLSVNMEGIGYQAPYGLCGKLGWSTPLTSFSTRSLSWQKKP